MEHFNTNSTKITPGQDPDEFLHKVYMARGRLSPSSPPDGPTDPQYKDTLQEAVSPELRVYFGLADIRLVMAVIYAHGRHCRVRCLDVDHGSRP